MDNRFQGVQMKAVRIHEQGDTSVIKWEEAPEQELTPDGVRIAVKAIALNHLDLWVRRGIPGMRISMPRVLGADAAGAVVETGDKVTDLDPGQRVLVSPGVSCGHCEYCLSDRDNLCRFYGIYGESLDGVHREQVVIPRRNVIALDPETPFDKAAAGGLAYLTAWHMLTRKARLRAGETVLIWGVGSGVGSAALDISRLIGANVIATAGEDWKLEKARELGAKHVLNHSGADIAAQVKNLTRKKGVDVVFEHPGEATWETSIACLSKGGRLVTCGATTGWEAKIDLRFLFFKQYELLGSTMGSYGDMCRVVKLIEQGRLNPVIDTRMPIAEIAEAHERIEQRGHFGKVVLIND